MFKRIKLKRINHLYKKACKALAKFDNAIGKDTTYQFFKQIICTVYGKEYMNKYYGKVMTPIYEDTDSLKTNETCKNCSYFTNYGICNLGHICLHGSEWKSKTDDIADGMKYTE